MTGGAGFIGANCVVHYAEQGHAVTVLDNLSRAGAEKNLAWIQGRCKATFARVDLRRYEALVELVKAQGPYDLVLHLGAQVAVTLSVNDPRQDFDINALGTFNLLEALRLFNPEAFIIYASTNKVYGEMGEHTIVESDGRYTYRDLADGVDESQNLDFHSPYGCSKGAADQYCLDYSRIYGLKTVSMRQSCIYGYRQFGVEDQGWVAWFCIAAATGKPITVYGDGKQVRDVLFIDDLINAYELAFENKEKVSGKAFNVGGGIQNILSLNDLIFQLEEVSGRNLDISYDGWRPGDQRVYISSIRKAKEEIGWAPMIPVEDGVAKIYEWVTKNRRLFSDVL